MLTLQADTRLIHRQDIFHTLDTITTIKQTIKLFIQQSIPSIVDTQPTVCSRLLICAVQEIKEQLINQTPVELVGRSLGTKKFGCH
jgi:hypothetical protein